MSAASLRTVRGTLSACCLGLAGAVLFNFVMETTDTTSEKRLEAGPFVLLSVANRAYKAPVHTSLIYRSFGRRTVLIRNVASYEDEELRRVCTGISSHGHWGARQGPRLCRVTPEQERDVGPSLEPLLIFWDSVSSAYMLG